MTNEDGRNNAPAESRAGHGSGRSVWRRIARHFKLLRGKGHAPTLRLNEWEIWHTYASYLHVEKVDLEFAARRLVEDGIAVCAMVRGGRTYWSAGGHLGFGVTDVTLNSEASRATIHLKKDEGCDITLEGFAAEAWYEAGHFRFNEVRVFGDDSSLPPRYVRAFLGECNLFNVETPDRKTHLYPVLLIYESGVVLLELRMVSAGDEISLEDFINDGVNLSRHSFDRVEVAPGLVKLATRAWYHSYRSWTFPYRVALLWLERGHDEAVRRLTRLHQEGDFAFRLAPLSGEAGALESERLSSIALTIFHTVAFVLGRPRTGLSFLIRGQRLSPKLGDFWSGRPHIYLVRFQAQRETAHQNEDDHGDAFGSILLKVATDAPGLGKKYLPRDRRLFNDYNAYVKAGASLWVWSESGIRSQQEWADPNRGQLIYEHQALVELLEYGYMLHRSFLEKVEGYASADEVFAARRALLKLDRDMRQAGHFGEIRDLLDHGWSELGVPDLRRQIQEALRLRETETRAAEARMGSRIGQALTILFGLIAVPSLAEQIIVPAWGFVTGSESSHTALMRIGATALSFGLVGVLVAALMWRFRIRMPRQDW